MRENPLLGCEALSTMRCLGVGLAASPLARVMATAVEDAGTPAAVFEAFGGHAPPEAGHASALSAAPAMAPLRAGAGGVCHRGLALRRAFARTYAAAVLPEACVALVCSFVAQAWCSSFEELVDALARCPANGTVVISRDATIEQPASFTSAGGRGGHGLVGNSTAELQPRYRDRGAASPKAVHELERSLTLRCAIKIVAAPGAGELPVLVTNGLAVDLLVKTTAKSPTAKGSAPERSPAHRAVQPISARGESVGDGDGEDGAQVRAVAQRSARASGLQRLPLRRRRHPRERRSRSSAADALDTVRMHRPRVGCRARRER